MGNEPNDDLSLPSLPPNTQLFLMNFPDDPDWNKEFSDELSAALIELSHHLDLERLAGVTVGYDFDAALMSVDLGFESTKATEYTNDGNFICVAKAMSVLRDGRPMSHVVYNANVIEHLTDPQHVDHNMAIHIIAHEMGHVAELKWRDEGMPGIMLTYRSPTFVDAILLQMATACWEEYAACRLTAGFGDALGLLAIYAESFNTSVKVALRQAQEEIKTFRGHGDVEKLLIDAGKPLAMPFKLAGYFLGHMDGLDDETKLESLCPDLSGSIYEPIVPKIWTELRKLWDTKEQWKSIAIFDGLLALGHECFAAAGIDLQKQPDGNHYVHVPYTAVTMPNGEADMAQIHLEATLKNLLGPLL